MPTPAVGLDSQRHIIRNDVAFKTFHEGITKHLVSLQNPVLPLTMHQKRGTEPPLGIQEAGVKCLRSVETPQIAG